MRYAILAATLLVVALLGLAGCASWCDAACQRQAHRVDLQHPRADYDSAK